jgi:hypothetical protein
MHRAICVIPLLIAVACGGDIDGPTPTPALLDCADDLVRAPGWFDADQGPALTGAVELAQTHIVAEEETRMAPVPIAERGALLLFTPAEALPLDTDLRVGAFDGETLLGVVAAREPSRLPAPLEASLTGAEVDPYSEEAWSAELPWRWMREGLTLRVGHVEAGTLRLRDIPLRDLGAPHRLTVSRAKIVLFGDADLDTATQPAARIARDFFASVPVAELRWVDYLPWRLEEILVRTPTGPQLVRTEAERQAVSSDADHWSILKHQLALRLSLANTGRGLALTVDSEGDSSPYSFGTSVGMGWFENTSGVYTDIDDAPWAAGWTGWTAMWLGECGNTFIHELGHSFTLQHFTSGTAQSWGIDDEYPLDGTHLATHPWGYDSTRHRPRTWYRVDAAGPVRDAGDLVGKHDPMNGGEAANAQTCFPQYTGFHAQKIQNWVHATPTLADPGDAPGVYLWDPAIHDYRAQAVDPAYQAPIAVDVPVVTLIGGLGNAAAPSRTYPPLFAASGNVFELPDPLGAGLDGTYDGARWFLEIGYEDGSVERALIARGEIVDPALYLYSMNLAAERVPVQVDLYRSPTGYPNIDLVGATRVHSRDIVLPDEALPPVVTVGRGQLANDELMLRERCEPSINCDRRRAETQWRTHAGQLHFQDPDGRPAGTDTCLEAGAFTVLELPAVNSEGGGRETLVVHAQRVVTAGGIEVAVPINDVTPWLDHPDLSQGLRLWLPWEPNQGLAAGLWRAEGEYALRGLLSGAPFSETPVRIELEVLERTPIDLAAEYLSEGLSTPDSSMYFLVRDPAVGPTERVWWDDGIPGPTILRPQVVEEGTGTITTLVLEAQQEACSQRWDFHAGRGAGNCTHHAVLRVAAGANSHLVAGRSYRTPDSAPLVVEGRRWHAPNARQLIGVFAFEIAYTVP